MYKAWGSLMLADSIPAIAEESIELTIFSAGSFQFGIESSQVRGSRLMPESDLLQIETILAIKEQTAELHRQTLIIKHPDGDYELSVSSPLQLCTLPASAIYPLPVAVTNRCTLPGLRAIGMIQGNFIMLLDICSIHPAPSETGKMSL